jgi:nucleoside-diphosphate-sugar epimerase
MKVNAEGTANVVNVAMGQKNTRLLHVSSVAAIGRTSQPGIINEEIEWEDSKLNSNYAISKYLSEREVWRWYR